MPRRKCDFLLNRPLRGPIRGPIWVPKIVEVQEGNNTYRYQLSGGIFHSHNHWHTYLFEGEWHNYNDGQASTVTEEFVIRQLEKGAETLTYILIS